MKTDFKKLIDTYSAPRGTFEVVTVPAMRFLMIDGHGDPNTSRAYEDALATIYPVAYKLKFRSRGELGRDYAVMPLEALWWSDDMDFFTIARDKSRWSWTLMNMVPDWITAGDFDAVRVEVERKGGAPALGALRLETLDEGLSVQTLHVGSYDDEGPVLDLLHHDFIPAHSLIMTDKHHEIYLSDPRRTAAEKLRTILRQPVARSWNDHGMDAGDAGRSHFDGTDLAGAVFRDVDLRGATITGLITGLVINEVEVEPLIIAELDRRHPERILLRSDDPDDLRRAWALIRAQWAATIRRAEQLPPSLQRLRVNGEWSVVETPRHLVYVADDWFGRTVLGEPAPYWRAGAVPTFLVEFQSEAGIDPSADPDLAEVLDRWHARVAQIDHFLDGLTDDQLAAEGPPSLSVGGTSPVTVSTCVHTVLDEFAAHRRYAERDLDALAQPGAG